MVSAPKYYGMGNTGISPPPSSFTLFGKLGIARGGWLNAEWC